jgi:ATP-binding cassette subfamily B protein
MNTRLTARHFRLVFAFCWQHWRRQLGLVLAMALLMLSATVGDATIPIFAGRLIDALALVSGGMAAAVSAVLGIFGLAIIVAALRFSVFVLLSRSSSRIMQDIVSEAFFRVQRFSTDWHASTFAGATVRKITRGMWAYDRLADTLILGFIPALAVLLAVSVLLTSRWTIMGAVVIAGVAAFLSLSTTLVMRFVAPAARQANETDSRLGAALADAISCNAVVKSFAGEVREDQRLGALLEQWRARTYRSWMRGTAAGATQNVTVVILQASVLGLAVWLWGGGRATPGDIAYVLTTYSIIQGYLREIHNHVRNLQQSVNDLEDVALFAGRTLGVEDRPAALPLVRGPGRVEFDRVSFGYGGQDHLLYRDFSLVLRAGERIGLVGESGSGKSTFVKLVQRLYDLDGGRILIDGQDIADVAQESLRSAVAVVPQEPLLFHRSIAENIAYGRPDACRDEIVAAARKAHAHDFIAALPRGYDTLVGERGVKLSGGERQRVALARAVLAEAEILIFDEATSSVDSLSEALMQQAVEAVTRGRTTIIIAHRLSTVQRVDRILVFDAGRVVEQGTHAELLARSDSRYRRLFESQALGLVGPYTPSPAYLQEREEPARSVGG